jgi:hypothetical protein
MNTGVIVERIAAASLAPKARITGSVYLLYFLTAVHAGQTGSLHFSWRYQGNALIQYRCHQD